MSSSASEPLLEVIDLNLAFPTAVFRSSTLKDIFIQALKAPWSYFQNRKFRSILKGISFQVRRGDFIAIIGVNGSGKTSLARCLSGVLQPNQGQIVKRAKIHAVIQTESGFYPELTGRENANLLAQFIYHDLSNYERQKIVDEAIEFSDLGVAADAMMETYSLGMKSRLSLSLTTARPQEILILDEVYNHADEFFQRKAEARIRAQIENSGAVIMISHYERDLMQICNRALVLHEGVIKYDGPPGQALKAYRFLMGGTHG